MWIYESKLINPLSYLVFFFSLPPSTFRPVSLLLSKIKVTNYYSISGRWGTMRVCIKYQVSSFMDALTNLSDASLIWRSVAKGFNSPVWNNHSRCCRCSSTLTRAIRRLDAYNTNSIISEISFNNNPGANTPFIFGIM